MTAYASPARLLGHERQRRLLQKALHGDRPPHALLLHGINGVGKYLVALEAVAELMSPSAHAKRPMLATTSSDVIVLRDLLRQFVLPVSYLRQVCAAEGLSATAEETVEALDLLRQDAFLKEVEVRKESEILVSWRFDHASVVSGSPKRFSQEKLSNRLEKLKSPAKFPIDLSRFARCIWSLYGGTPYLGTIKIGDIREQIQTPLSYVSGGRPVCVIIDDAQNMTEEAENALLKQLEEPPSRCVFFLITSAEHRLLPTIRSRCQSLAFGSLPDEVISEALHDFRGTTSASLTPFCHGSLREALLISGDGDRQIRLALLKEYTALKAGKAPAVLGLADRLFPSELSDRTERRAALQGRLRLLESIVRDLDLLQNGNSTVLRNQDLERELRAAASKLPELRYLDDQEVIAEFVRRLGYNLNERLALEAMGLRIQSRVDG